MEQSLSDASDEEESIELKVVCVHSTDNQPWPRKVCSYICMSLVIIIEFELYINSRTDGRTLLEQCLEQKSDGEEL